MQVKRSPHPCLDSAFRCNRFCLIDLLLVYMASNFLFLWVLCMCTCVYVYLVIFYSIFFSKDRERKRMELVSGEIGRLWEGVGEGESDPNIL